MMLRFGQDTFPFVERWLSKPPGRHVGFFCFLAVLAIGYIDYRQGTNITLSVVYAVPISAAALFIGTVPALWLSLFSVVISLGGDYLLIQDAIAHGARRTAPADGIWLINGVCAYCSLHFW
jgi:hypothetical protein